MGRLCVENDLNVVDLQSNVQCSDLVFFRFCFFGITVFFFAFAKALRSQ